MSPDTIDWPALRRLREAYLRGDAGLVDYWQRESDLASYDATFAQRIGWKWDYVFAALKQRGWIPSPGTLTDWGCGSGIAARAYLDAFGAGGVARVHCWDRSPLAARFAADKARRKHTGLEVSTSLPEAPETVLLSHVLTELNPAELGVLLQWLAPAHSVLWVEPGTHAASRALIAVREALRERFDVIAPCLHRAACGLLTPGNEPHWCHHFAAPPPAVFTDPFWGRFAQVSGVDLRSLPLSYLVLDRRPAAAVPSGAVRVLGRPRVYKAHAAILACDEAGVAEANLLKRDAPGLFRKLRKDDCPSLLVWRRDGDRLAEVCEPAAAASPPAPGELQD